MAPQAQKSAGRPVKTASPRLTALLGEDSTRHLTEALGTEAARDLDRELAQLGQLGQLNSIRFQSQLLVLWIKQSEQATAQRFEDLDRKLDLLAALLEQHTDAVQRDILNTDGYIVQANEVIRGLRSESRRDRRSRTTVRRFGPRRWPANKPAPIVLASRAVAAD